jgi:hypothetical protein
MAQWGSSYNKPRYEAGIERRRLLVINALLLSATRLGCRPSMSTSKYNQDSRDERQLGITIGETHVYFTVEGFKSKKEPQVDRLRIALGRTTAREQVGRSWEDNDESSIEDQLTEIMIELLVKAEDAYRESLVSHRDWIIERKAAAEAEIRKQKEEADRKERELQEKLANERIGRLLSQAKALQRASEIRTYVDMVLRSDEPILAQTDVARWAAWARDEADRIDPIKNGTLVQSAREAIATTTLRQPPAES